jgi:hypothetical protein
VYPIIDLSQRYLGLDEPTDLAPVETFSLNMIYSIACHIIPNTAKRQDARNLWQSSGKQAHYQANCLKYRNLAGKFYNKAMDHVEAATLEPTVDTLRAVLLMAINSLFDPKSGNIGQQIALAARIAYSLEATAQQEGTTSSNAKMLRNMHMTIFSIENEIASTLDRPATFPEPVSFQLLELRNQILIIVGMGIMLRQNQASRVHVLAVPLAASISQWRCICEGKREEAPSSLR